MNSLSIIIVTFNSESTIEQCLDSLDLKSETEFFVVDNNSTDKTGAVVEKFKQVRLIKSQENLGFGKANNLAAKESKSDYLLFLNPDCIVQKDAIEKLSNYLDNHKEVAVVGPKLLNQKGALQREMSPFPTFLSQVLILLKLHRLPFFQNLVYPNYNFNQIQEAEHLMGAALMIRRAAFEKVGGFDEKFFLWFEETDLLKRIFDLGHKIIYFPESKVIHLTAQSTKQLNFFAKQNIWNKSLLYFFKKHKGSVETLLLLPFILLSYPAALLVSILRR